MLGFSLMIIVWVVLTGCSNSTASAIGKRAEVRVRLTEFRVESSLTTFATSMPYHFIVKNEGKLAHDWLIVPVGARDESPALLQVPVSALQPGSTVTRDLVFAQAGNWELACHVPGDYEAEMRVPIVVK